jgi:hypothetical protein
MDRNVRSMGMKGRGEIPKNFKNRRDYMEGKKVTVVARIKAKNGMEVRVGQDLLSLVAPYPF